MKLNIPKTDVLIAQNSSIQLELPVDVGDVTITPSKAVRNLGVIIDSNLSLEPHVSNLCKRAFYHIRRISQIRRFLDKDTTARLVSAFVTSTLDNCNSILYGLPKKISRSTAKCSKCCGASHQRDETQGAYHTTNQRAPLATGLFSHRFQNRNTCLLLCKW